MKLVLLTLPTTVSKNLLTYFGPDPLPAPYERPKPTFFSNSVR